MEIPIIGSAILNLETILGETRELILLNPSILVSISLIVIVAALFAFFSKLLKQELILAYIIAGIVLGPLVFGLIKDQRLITGFAEIGITLLLFTAGIEISLKKLRETMNTSLIVGFLQVFFVTLASFFVLIAFKFSIVEAIWLGIAVSFSSTVVITKILSDKNELNTLHGRFIIGIMLAQDILAIMALAILTKNLTWIFVLISFLKITAMILLAIILSFFLKPIIRKASNSTELLFMISLAFLFLFVLFAYFLNLSIAIGAFIAGVALANTPYKIEVSTRIKPLRDFFSVLFFVSIGLLLTNLSIGIILPVIAMLFVLIIIEPFVTALFLRIRGYEPKTSLQIGFSFAQLSEFTLVLTLTALGLGIISNRAFDIIVLTAVISIAITPYTMKLAKPLNGTLGYLLSLIKTNAKREKPYFTPGKKTIFLVGSHRMGSIFLKHLEKIKDKVIVLDFNPEIISALEKKKISCMYGDLDNINILNRLPLKNIEIVISTVPEKDDGLLLIKYFKKINPDAIIVLTAQRIDEALELYARGADYVIMPLISSAEYFMEKLSNPSKENFKKLKKEQIEHLKNLHHYLY